MIGGLHHSRLIVSFERLVDVCYMLTGVSALISPPGCHLPESLEKPSSCLLLWARKMRSSGDRGA
jgi:hypothetical protein